MRRISRFAHAAVAIAVALAVGATLSACTEDSRAAESTKAMDAALSDERPGCSAAAAHAGGFVWAHARGLADEANDRVLTTSTRFNTGSVSKQFTATAILMLDEQGVLSVDDPIRDHLVEFRHGPKP